MSVCSERGTISYDGVEMGQLDPHSLRRNIGTVLQDGKLFSGDILSNITITAPWLGMDEAWERGYRYAKEYYRANHSLLNYRTADGGTSEERVTAEDFLTYDEYIKYSEEVTGDAEA